MKIVTVIPTATRRFCEEYVDRLKPYLLPSTELHAVAVDLPLPHLEYYFYGAQAVVGIIERMKDAERDGFDAAIIGCFYDTGLREAREVLTMPVVGPGEASFHHAAMTAEAVGVVVGRRKMFPKLRENAATYGIASKIVAWETAELTIPELRTRSDRVYVQLRDACSRALERGAEVVVLACGSMTYYAQQLTSDLQCAILDPRLLSVKYAEMMGGLYRSAGLTHSKLGGYETPPITTASREPIGVPAGS